jgi:hypothetical protein
MDEQKLPLSRLIEAVTEELHKAEERAQSLRDAGEKPDPIMQFEECELEMAVEIELSGKAETNVWVFKLGGGVKKTDANTIKVKFKRLEGTEMTFASKSKGQGPRLGRKRKRKGSR